MDAYTAEALIELGTELLKEDDDRAELHFMGDDLYDLVHIDMDEVYKHFENLEEFINEVKKIGGDLK